MKKKDRIIKEWFYAFSIAIIITIILMNIIWPMRVDGKSMEKTLGHGDYILVSKAILYIDTCTYNDLVVIDYEENGIKEKIVKRIIGIEGDHIVIKDGLVYRNSTIIDETYVNDDTLGEIDLYIPKDGYFVLGDNRKVSKDSRNFGCIFEKNIRAKVIAKIF